ncbi:MAG TPA: DUF4199 domain-containing protein [Saprospiraceae bacterium]|nr:DUF4199 domain-containing protein [Saprospiraceae bacterium]
MSTLDQPLSENKSLSPWPFALRYGLIIGLIGIVLGLILYLMMGTGGDFPDNAWIYFSLIGLLSFVIGIVGLVLSAKAYRKALGGFISFNKAFQAAFFTGLVVIGVSLVWQIFNETVLVPDMEAYSEQMARMFMEPFGMPPEQIDEALDAQRPMYKGLGRSMLNTVFGGGIFYTIVALIVGATVKKTQPDV